MKYLFIMSMLFFHWPGNVWGYGTEVIQPQIYTSSKGAYAMSVLPNDPDGLSGATYEMKQAGDLLWSKQLSFTAVMSDVSNEGDFITCSHSRGLDGGDLRTSWNDKGYLDVKLFDVAGQLKWSQSIKRHSSMRMHASPEPSCTQVLINNHSMQAYVWYATRQIEEELIALDIIHPKQLNGVRFEVEGLDKLTSVHSVKYHGLPGSSFLMAEVIGWVYEDNEKGNGYNGYLSDALFYLLDYKGHVLWHKHLMGSLDNRKFSSLSNGKKEDISTYIADNDLFSFDPKTRRFKITNYMERAVEVFQLKDKKVNKVDSESFSPNVFKFKTSSDVVVAPTLINSLSLSGAIPESEEPCESSFSVADTLSDGSLVLFDEDSFSISIFSLQSLLESKPVPLKFSIPKTSQLEDYISGNSFFIGANDLLYINLGHASFAVYDINGNLIETINMDAECKDLCNTAWLANKKGLFWQHNYYQGFKLLAYDAGQSQEKAILRKDSNGQWLEYIYDMKSDLTGRLLALGKVGKNLFKLYLFGADGQPLLTINTGHKFLQSMTLSEGFIFLSLEQSNEILQLNLKGELLNRFITPNDKKPYLLQASEGRLFAITNGEVVVYEIK